MPLWLWIVLAVALLLVFPRRHVAASRRRPHRLLRPRWHARSSLGGEEELQNVFFTLAASSGKPRGLRWKSIDWHEGAELVREKGTRRLATLVGVTIAFEAIPGSDMEGSAAVGNLRHGSAVFFFHGGNWHTTGKVIFNLMPEEVLARFAAQYERIAS